MKNNGIVNIDRKSPIWILYRFKRESREKCHICGNETDWECRQCGGPVCEECTVPYNQFTQVDYTLCKKCEDSMRESY